MLHPLDFACKTTILRAVQPTTQPTIFQVLSCCKIITKNMHNGFQLSSHYSPAINWNLTKVVGCTALLMSKTPSKFEPVLYYSFGEVTFLSMKNSQNADIEKNEHESKHLFSSFLVTSEGPCFIGRTFSCLQCLSETLLVVLELSAPFLGLFLAFSTRMANSVVVQLLTGFPAVITWINFEGFQNCQECF